MVVVESGFEATHGRARCGNGDHRRVKLDTQAQVLAGRVVSLKLLARFTSAPFLLDRDLGPVEHEPRPSRDRDLAGGVHLSGDTGGAVCPFLRPRISRLPVGKSPGRSSRAVVRADNGSSPFAGLSQQGRGRTRTCNPRFWRQAPFRSTVRVSEARGTGRGTI